MMFNLQQFAINLLANNPRLSNDPKNRELVEAIRNGDNAKGEELANNLCSSIGKSREEVCGNAKRFFGI